MPYGPPTSGHITELGFRDAGPPRGYWTSWPTWRRRRCAAGGSAVGRPPAPARDPQRFRIPLTDRRKRFPERPVSWWSNASAGTGERYDPRVGKRRSKVRKQRSRRDVVDVLTLPLMAAVIALWALLGASFWEPLKDYNYDMFWTIGLFLALVVMMFCAYFGHGDEWD